MRVLIIDGSLRPPTFVQNLINGLLHFGVDVCLMGKNDRRRMSSAGKLTYAVYPVRGGISIILQFCSLFFLSPRALYRSIKISQSAGSLKLRLKRYILFAKIFRYNPDIIHVQWATHLSQLEDLINASLFKVVVSLRGRQINVAPLSEPEVASLFHRLFPFVHGFHAVSHAIAREALLYGAPQEKIRVIYSILDKSTSSGLSHSVIRKKQEPLKVLVVGRFHWMKGYHHLLKAVSILKHLKHAVKLTMIVQGEMPEEILFQIYDLGIRDDIEWIKGAPHAAVLDKMRQQDVMVLSSVKEGVANVVLEAMSNGLPVITTDCGGMNEVVRDGVNGFLVPVRDPEALADALLRFDQLSIEEVDRLRKNAQDTIEDKFNREKNLSEFVKLYQQVVACE